LRSGHQSYMAIPIELRAPFLDHNVVEFASQLPLDFLIRDGWHKWILRKSMETLLPPEIVWRPRKVGFPFPLSRWLRRHQVRLLALADQVDFPWIDVGTLRSRYLTLSQQAPELVWRLLSVLFWWKRCVQALPLMAA